MGKFTKIELDAKYDETIAALASNPHLSEGFRLKSMQITLQQSRWNELSAYTKAEVLRDFIALLTNQWNANDAQQWQPTHESLIKLKDQLSLITGDSPEQTQLKTKITDEIDAVALKLYVSFDTFARAEGAQPFGSTDEYSRWLNASLANLTLDLSPDDTEKNEQMITEHAQYYLSRMPEASGMEESVSNRIWDYARRAIR